jgi:PA14 domain
MKHLTTFLIRHLAGILALTLLLLAPAVRAQTAPPVNTFLLPFTYYAPATSGEPVLFTGQITLETQLVPDAIAGPQLLVNVIWSGLVGTAQPSQTRYVLTGQESVMLPHASLQTMEISFPMVPSAGGPVLTTRTGVANFSFFVNTTTGAISSIASGSVSVTGPGMGLMASYFGNRELVGVPTVQRMENVNFLFQGKSPVPGVEGQNWGARWEGYIMAAEAGMYTFQTRSDDGVRLRLSDVLVIDRDYYQGGSDSVMQLKWRRPGSTLFEPIPAAQLDAVSVATPVYTYSGRGLLAQYFNNTSLSGVPVLQRTEAVTINIGNGSPAPGVVATDNYSVRWQGSLTIPVTGSYVFQTRADDGVRLWVNGVLMVNDWSSFLARDNTTVALNLTAGQQVSIVMEYYEGGGDSTALLRWRPPGASTYGLIPQTLLNPPAGY